MKQQQADHIFLMFRGTWRKDFLNQQAIFTTMKSCAHLLISNYVQWGNPSDDKSLTRLLTEVKTQIMNSKKRWEIKMEFGDIYCCNFCVVLLRWLVAVGGCKVLGLSSHDVMSVLHVFVHSALFQTIFWRWGDHWSL